MLKQMSMVPKLRASVSMEMMLLIATITFFITRNFGLIGYEDSLTLHIGYLLVGLLLIFLAVILVLTIFGKYIDSISSVLAGLGFGIVIGDLEKFVFASSGGVDEEMILISYFVFIVLFFYFKYFLIFRKANKKDYLINVMELVQDAMVTDGKDKISYERVDFLLKKIGVKNSTALNLNQLIYSEFDIISPTAENSFSKKIERWYGVLLQKKIVEILLILFFVAMIGFNSYFVLDVILGGWPLNIFDFSRFELILFMSTGFIVLMALGGIVEILVDRRNNYNPLEFTLYLSIFLQQLFIFDENLICGSVVIILSLVALFFIKYMIYLEQRYEYLHLLGRKNIIKKR